MNRNRRDKRQATYGITYFKPHTTWLTIIPNMEPYVREIRRVAALIANRTDTPQLETRDDA